MQTTAATTGATTGDNLGNHTATQALKMGAYALTGTGANLGTTIGLGIRADGGLNIGQNTTGANINLDFEAGYSNTTGSNNQFIGNASGYANTTGSYNLFSGYYSGLANTTGSNNQFSGYRSGLSNTTGSDNLFSGYQSGYYNTTGINNLFNGSSSGYKNTTGSNNLFSGYQSGYYNTTGSNNLFSGYQSGANNTTGSYNQFSGYQSGIANTTGSENQISGYASGQNNTTGSDNQFSGSYSGFYNTTGSANLFSGTQSGYSNTTGNNNLFSGYQSGQTNTTGSNNTALGSSADFSSSVLTNATAIGANAVVSQSNSLVLGGTGTNAVNVGISTSAPTAKLTVQLAGDADQGLLVTDGTTTGNIVIQPLTGNNTGFSAINYNGYHNGTEIRFNPAKNRWRVGTDQRGTSDLFFIDTYNGTTINTLAITASGNVGIGTTNPIAKLHVNGSVNATDVTNNVSYFTPGSNFAANAPIGAGGIRALSAYFEGGQFWVNNSIVAGAMNVSSDRRIKHVVGLSDRAADLEMLNKIRVTDYTYIDKLANTDKVVKKVIAQEIQALMPVAVNASYQAIPNVYEKAARVSFANGRVTVTTAKAHELPATTGKMRLYTTTNVDVNTDVTVVDAHTFSFASDKAYADGLFVYGKFVDDFLSVDYDAIAMLNVSATQELARQVAELQKQNATLQAQVGGLQTKTAQAEADHASLLTLQAQMARLLGGDPQAHR